MSQSDDRVTADADDRGRIHDETDDRSALAHLLGWCWDTVRAWGPALVVVLVIRSVVAEPFRIPSGSMMPTLAIGDHILITKFSYGLRWPLTRIPIGKLRVPERGDVIVFVYPPSDTDTSKLSHWLDLPFPPIATYDYIKRVVGLPGESIQVIDNVVYIDGKPLKYMPQNAFQFVDDHCRVYTTREEIENLGGHDHAVLVSTGYGQRMADYGPVTVPPDHVFVMGDNRDHSSDSRVWGFVPLRNIKGKARFIWLSYDQCQPGIPIIGRIRTERFGDAIE